MLRPPRALGLAFTAVCLVLVFFTFWARRHPSAGLDITQIVKGKKSSCDRDLDLLKRHLKLPPTINYARRRILTKPANSLRQDSIVHRDDRLIESFAELDLEDQTCALPKDANPLVIEFPTFTRPSQVDTSSIMFGASTNLDRVRAAIPYMSRWLGNLTSPIVINIHDSKDFAELENVQNAAEAAGIDIQLIMDPQMSEGEDWHAQRHFDILKTLYKHRQDHHQWFGIIDDDTFIPSLPALLEALNQYDPSEPYYIGALSESWTAVAEFFGYMAYGGAGMFLSRPLLDALYENFDACRNTASEGDSMYSDCIYQKISPSVQLTRLDGLHQLDMRIDASGWYEGGIRPILSLHHFRSWHIYPVEFAHLVTDICGHQCFLQRYQFADDFVLTNAYSIVQYPTGTKDIDFNRVEATFEHKETDFDFSLGSLRPALSPKEKISYRLEYAIRENNGHVRQFYIKRKGDATSDAERLRQPVESVLELEWSR